MAASSVKNHVQFSPCSNYHRPRPKRKNNLALESARQGGYGGNFITGYVTNKGNYANLQKRGCNGIEYKQ